MIVGLQPYPAMKDSRVPWQVAVRRHWEVLPSRALFTAVKERDHPEEQMLSVTSTKGVILPLALLADSSKNDGSNQAIKHTAECAEETPPVIRRIHKSGTPADPLRGLFLLPLPASGRGVDGEGPRSYACWTASRPATTSA